MVEVYRRPTCYAARKISDMTTADHPAELSSHGNVSPKRF